MRIRGAVALALLAAAAPVEAQLPAWITVDSSAHAVDLAFEVAGGGPGGTAVLNGHRHGDLQLVVPLGWTVRWTWVHRDSARTHSLVVMAEREKLPGEGGRPAFENAMTRAVVQGMKAGQRDVTTFLADQAGWYWMLCGVPGHALQGEWIGLKIDREATAVGVVRK